MIDDFTEESGAIWRCRQCDREMQLGEDAFELEQGVLGPRGFVPLENTVLFCSEACARGFLGGTNEEIKKLPRRVP